MKILFLSHNIPYPPNKGEKNRAFQTIRHFAQEHEVHLYTLCKDPDEVRYAKELEAFCHTVHAEPLSPLASKVRALLALVSGDSLTARYFYSPRFARDVSNSIASENFDFVFGFCSSIGQYFGGACPRVIDFVDADSYKWNQYSRNSRFPKSLVYRTEWRRLERLERRLVESSALSVVTTQRELEKLAHLAPGHDDRLLVSRLGIDTDRFSAGDPYTGDPTLVFTGQMDYRPNIEAVIYFCESILPLIRKTIPGVRFNVVGRNPPSDLAAQCPGANVTGAVHEIKPWLTEATVFVAPMRLAFGTQTKVLEAMACATPVVATPSVLGGLGSEAANGLLVAEKPEAFAERVIELINNPDQQRTLGEHARQFVLTHHNRKTIMGELEEQILVHLGDRPSNNGN